MQNVTMRVPAALDTWSQPSGSNNVSYVAQPSSSRFFIRNQSGYTGKHPKQRPYPIHAYTFRVDDITMSHTYDHIDNSNNHTWGSGPCLSPSSIVGINLHPTFDSLDTTIYNEVVDKLNDQTRGNLDVSVDLAEAHQTAKMFRVVEKAVDYTRTFFKSGPLRFASNAWLEYTYGVKPLLSSIYGIADENLRTVINKTAHFSARVSKTFNPDSIDISTIWGMMNFPVVKGSSIKRSYTLGLDMRTDQFDLARWSSLNPLSIAWELTPYSFVADWFLNVGGYLRNMETYLLYANKFRSGYRTRLTVGEIAFKQYRTSIGGFKYVSDAFYGTAKLTIIERILLTSYPAPELPSFNARLGSSRLTSAAALLSQLLKVR